MFGFVKKINLLIAKAFNLPKSTASLYLIVPVVNKPIVINCKFQIDHFKEMVISFVIVAISIQLRVFIENVLWFVVSLLLRFATVIWSAVFLCHRNIINGIKLFSSFYTKKKHTNWCSIGVSVGVRNNVVCITYVSLIFDI